MRLLSRCGIMAIVLVCLSAPLTAQLITPSDRLALTAEVYRFRGGDDQNMLVEIAYAFGERTLTYKPDSAGFAAAADMTVTIALKDSIVHADRWLVPHSVRDTSAFSQGMNLVGLYRLQLEAGDYVLTLLARDRYDANRRDSVAVRLPIRLLSTKEPVLSDVELATVIRQGTKGGIFYKNTLDVVPNVGGMFSEEQKCFYYVEAYNLLASADTSDFVVRTILYDAVGKEIISRERPRKRAGESSVIIDQFPVKNLRTGTYSLVLSLLGAEGKPVSSSGRKLFVFNPTLGVDSSLLSAASSLPLPQYMGMDEVELDREFQWARYAALDDEKTQYEALKGVEAKRKFMSDFWRHRAPGEREEYLARVAYANTNFRVLSREGYRTDRGRVVIMYGQPDDVERHPNETETRPYEIWSYNNIQGGVIFVFVLRNSASDYELVHSTHRNELHDENWDRIGITR